MSFLTETRRTLSHTFRALGSPNYRLFFAGQLTSLIGSWMQRIAAAWLVYRLTDSEFLLGLVAFLSQAPTFFLSPLAGVYADRWDRRKALLWLQVADSLQAFALAILVFGNWIEVWHILALSLYAGFVSSFETPIRQSFIPQMVDRKEDLQGAIALNSSMFNAARLVGPALAGILIAWLGEGLCFLINGLSFMAIVWSLTKMRVVRPIAPSRKQPFWQNLREGVSYTFHRADIRTILLMVTVASIFALPYITLLPVFAKVVLGGGPDTYGFLTGAVGIGALAGALTLAMRRRTGGLPKVILFMLVLFGIGLVGFAISRSFVISCCCLVAAGYAMMLMFASANTLLQSSVEEAFRGRVISLYIASFIGIGPFGSLLAGWTAQKFGAPATVWTGGMMMFALAWYLRRRLMRMNAGESTAPAAAPA